MSYSDTGCGRADQPLCNSRGACDRIARARSKNPMRNIFESTEAFETWMRKRTDLSRRLLKKKHSQMAAGPFPFLRSTFYRWAEQWPRVCPELAGRPDDVLLVVGDLHVANFGVWCDSRR